MSVDAKPRDSDVLESEVLESDPGRPSTPTLIGRVLRAELGNASRRLSIMLGFRKLYEAVPVDWAIPDSSFAVRAAQVAGEMYPDYMVRHSFRSYCFGAILAARNQLKLDRETFFVAAMLHDLGLCDAHVNAPGSFEWVGAKLAYDFCLEGEQGEARAATIHNAIALHTSVGVADRHCPEVALLHFGTGMDLFGMRIDEVPPEVLEHVLSDYPRAGFKTEFTPCLIHQARSKPHSQIAGAVAMGITDRIKEELA